MNNKHDYPFVVGHNIYFLSGTKQIIRGIIKTFLYPHHFRVHGYNGVFDLKFAGRSPEEALENYKSVKIDHFEKKLATTQRTIDKLRALEFEDYKIKNVP